MRLFGANFATDGATRVWRGLRSGDQQSLLLGAAMLGFAWWRRGQNDQRQLLRRMELKKGESIVIRDGDSPPRRIDLT